MITDAEKYINLLTDFGFKKLFGSESNKDLLIDLTNEITPDRQSTLNFPNSKKTRRSWWMAWISGCIFSRICGSWRLVLMSCKAMSLRSCLRWRGSVSRSRRLMKTV